MARSPIVAAALLAAVALSGCVSHSWAPGPGAMGTFEMAQAKCSLFARHAGGEFYASGTQNFVAGAAFGAAVGNAIRTQDDFNDCMAANGWVATDGKRGGAADGLGTAAVPPTPAAYTATARNVAPSNPVPVLKCSEKDQADDDAYAQLAIERGYQYHRRCN